MHLAAALLLLPAMAFGLVVPDKVAARAVATPKPNPQTWVVDVWPGTGCVKGAATGGPAEPIKGNVAAGSGCVTNAVTYGSAIVKNAAGCTFVFYDDAQCTVANPLQATAVGKCVNFTPGSVVAMGVTCP